MEEAWQKLLKCQTESYDFNCEIQIQNDKIIMGSRSPNEVYFRIRPLEQSWQGFRATYILFKHKFDAFSSKKCFVMFFLHGL